MNEPEIDVLSKLSAIVTGYIEVVPLLIGVGALTGLAFLLIITLVGSML